MTALPAASAFTGSGVTEGEFKTQLTAMRAFLSGLLGADGTQATALTTLGALMNGSVAKSAGYTVVAADRGKLIDCSGTWTLAVDAVATLGAGFAFGVRNGGTGSITINPDLSEQINGVSTLVIGPGESCVVLTNADASGWLAVLTGGGGDGQFQSMKIITASGTYTKPVGLKRVKVTCVGGGGGGSNSVTANFIAFGGAGGGTAIKVIEASAIGATETVTIGGGGAGATGTASAAGGTGGTTSFGAHCSATGGAGGIASAGTSWPIGYGMSTGGNGDGGDINLPGGFATAPELGATETDSRSGGGGGSTHGIGATITPKPSNGYPGSGYGGGGGGGMANSSTDQNGGAGTAGICIVEEFF